MRFVVAGWLPEFEVGREQAVLMTNSWDDFTFRTTFQLSYFDGAETTFIGNVKVGCRHMPRNNQTDLPRSFEALPPEYFSLGQDASYYQKVKELGPEVRASLLEALNDIAYDTKIYHEVKDLQVTQVSLLRSVNEKTVLKQFKRIALGGDTLSKFDFKYLWPSSNSGQRDPLRFNVQPNSFPPSNIHAIIGSNGVGKTRLLGLLAQAVMRSDPNLETYGYVVNDSGQIISPFVNLVSISFSVFDQFPTSYPGGQVDAAFVSLRDGDHQGTSSKGYGALARDFNNSLGSLTGAARERWQRSVRMLQNDPLFRDVDVESLPAGEPLIDQGGSASTAATELFNQLSSGHKIVLLSITRMVELVAEYSLVLIDEPETHLHPPLLSAFIRSVSELLVDQNGVAIVATHSPVILQELPRNCVWKLRRSGDYVKVERPSIETFGENVGVLTHDTFGLEVTGSGFYRLIDDAVRDSHSYEEVLEKFNGQLGGEARGIARALFAAKNRWSDT